MSSDPYIGNIIQERYQVLKMLGAGGMGAVYLAEQISMGRHVALKVLRRELANDNAFVRRFHHEARLAGAISHPRVVTIYDFGEIEDGNLFLVMEYVPGDTLKTLIQEQQPLSVQRAVSIALQIAEALQAVHGAGILHRDIKPENIVVREGGQVKLMDFGIARQLDSHGQTELMRLTRTGVLIGSPGYMAPEQIDGKNEVSERTDIYAWGIILYELLTGEAPFVAPTWQAILLRHLQEPPKPVRQRRPEAPVDIEQIVMRALEKDPQRRQQSMSEVITALRKIELGEQPPKPVAEPLRRSRGTGKIVGVVIGSFLVVWGVATGARSLLKNPPPVSPKTEKIASPSPPIQPSGIAKKANTAADETSAEGKSPLSVDDLVLILQRISLGRVTEEVHKQGVNFEISAPIRERLRKAGADDALLMVVERESFAYTRERFREEQTKMEEQGKRIEDEANR